MTRAGSSDLAAVHALAKRVRDLSPQSAEQVALVAFMAGALHSLSRAIQCRFDDKRMTPVIEELASELPHVLESIIQSQDPPRPWLSGYYVGSAMMRIDALAERLGESVGPRKPLSNEIPDAVNAMKHEIDAGIGKGWEARFAHVLRDAEKLFPLLAKAVRRPAAV